MVDTTLINHLCNLSKLTLTEDEMQQMTADMETIIGIMDSINEVEIQGDIDRDKGVYFADVRKDEIEPSYATEKILANAKEKQDTTFAVPKLF